MFGKILYPTDFSDVSEKALDYIKQLKRNGVKEVVVLHVIDERAIASKLLNFLGAVDDTGKAFDVADYKTQLEDTTEEDAKEQTKAIKAQLEESGLNVKVRIERGIPLKDILKVEEEENVSFTVIGSHGKSCLQEMFHGSISENVMRKANKPVLVIKQ